MKYIYPPRIEHATPRDKTDIFRTLKYHAQYKVNDTRLVIIIESPDDIQLWNRHGKKLDYTPPPELQEQLKKLAEYLGPCVLDGGLLDAKHRAVKDTIALWDILAQNDQQLIGTTYVFRQELLHKTLLDTIDTVYHTANYSKRIIGSCHVGYNFADPVIERVSGKDVQISGGIFLVTNYIDGWDQMWDNIEETNKPYISTNTIEYSNAIQVETKVSPLIEGLVFKYPFGKLKPSFGIKNNTEWQGKSRVETGRHLF